MRIPERRRIAIDETGGQLRDTFLGLQTHNKEFADLPEKYKRELDMTAKVYKAAPSADCPNGTRGREPVFEMFEMDRDIEAAILRTPTESDIQKIVCSKGMITLKDDAIIKSMHQVVPFEEVNTLV